MGSVTSKLTKPIRNFNVESRAAKAIEKRQKVAVPAPKHASTTDKFKKYRQDHPELLEAQKIKDEKLNESLKLVYVESKDPVQQTKGEERALPLSRKPVQDTDLGVMDTVHPIPEGKANLKTILSFLGQHQLDPEKVTAQFIADEHKLHRDEVQHVLAHFTVLQLHIPKQMYKENSKLKKIMAQQTAAIATPFRLPGREKQERLTAETDVQHPKT